MVTLSRLYTKTGDGGLTRLGDMSQVPKTSARIAAYGCVDELNSVIGLARAGGAGLDDVLARVQNDLFDVGADLCVPRADGEEERLRLQPKQVLYLEERIDQLTARVWLPCAASSCPGAGPPPPGSTWRARSAGAPSGPSGSWRSRSRWASRSRSISTGSPTCSSPWPGRPTTAARRTCCGSPDWVRPMTRWLVSWGDLDAR